MSVATLAHSATQLVSWSVVLAAGIGLSRFRQLAPPLRYLALLAGFDMALELAIPRAVSFFHLKSNLFLFPFMFAGRSRTAGAGLPRGVAVGHAQAGNAVGDGRVWRLCAI